MDLFSSNKFGVILPVITLIFGWALSELSEYFRGKGERRRNLSKALSELLEIHHSLAGKKLVLNEVEKKTGIDISNIPEAEKYFQMLHFDVDEISKRYSQAVSLLSGYDPALAFYLRNKDKIIPLMAMLRNMLNSDPDKEEWMFGFIDDLEQIVIPSLEGSIRQLAWKIGPLTWVRTLRIVNSKQDIVNTLFEKLGENRILSKEKSELEN